MTRKLRISTVTTVSIVAMCMAVPALAQEAAKPGDETVVIVTANKRKEKLFDVAQSVNVVNGDQVQKLNLTQFDDVQKVVPGLNVTRGSGRDFSVSLRGVYFDPSSSVKPTVDLYLNEVPVTASTVLGGVYDVGDFQILRGPQGTLRSGTGPSGAILLSSKQASLNRAEGYYSLAGFDKNNQNAQFGYGLPLLGGKLAVRVAGLYDHNSGVEGNGVNYNDPDHSQTTSGRVALTFKPIDALTIHAMYQRLNSRTINSGIVFGTGSAGTFTTNDRVTLTEAPNVQLLKSDILTFDASWDLGGNTLTYVGGYQDNKSSTVRDADTGNNFPGGIQFYQRISLPSKSTTNEVRFERTGDHFWIYRFGAFYGHDQNNSDVLLDYTGSNGACLTSPGPLAVYGLPCLQLGSNDVYKSKGFFTTQTFKFTPSDILEVGARQSEFERTAGKFSAVTGSVNYKHYFSKDMMVYANYGTSYRPGNVDTATAQIDYMLPISYFTNTPERSKAIEVGVKTDLFSRRLSISADIFHQKFDGYLYKTAGVFCTALPNAATGPTAHTVYPTNDGLAFNGFNGCTGGSNAQVYLTGNADAISEGVEFEVRGRINSAWTAQLNASYIKAHFDGAEIYCNDFNGDGTPDNSGTPAVQRGKYISVCNSSDSLSALPKWTLALTSTYNFPISGNWDGFARGLANIKPKATDPFTSLDTPASNLVDLFLGATESKHRIEVSLFVKNLFDEITITPQPVQLNGYSYYNLNNGRRVGIQLRQSF